MRNIISLVPDEDEELNTTNIDLHVNITNTIKEKLNYKNKIKHLININIDFIAHFIISNL
jgi:hypothetical protein